MIPTVQHIIFINVFSCKEVSYLVVVYNVRGLIQCSRWGRQLVRDAQWVCGMRAPAGDSNMSEVWQKVAGARCAVGLRDVGPDRWQHVREALQVRSGPAQFMAQAGGSIAVRARVLM
jgi:hypothetical protein